MRKIILDEIDISFDEKKIIENFSCTFEEGECFVLTGASGKGKTTLLRTVLGLQTPDKGKITVPKGFRFTAAFQEDRLLPELSAAENLCFALPFGCRKDKDAARRFLTEILPEDAPDKKPAELSGGMCRRVAVARALFAPSDAVILDEPFAGLDGETAKTVSTFISAHRDGRLLILATHWPDLAPDGHPIVL